MTIIGLGHRRFVGKDSFAKFLLTSLKIHNSNHAIRAGFADILKDAAEPLYAWAGMKPRQYYDRHPEAKEKILKAVGKSPRQIWIEFGMAVRGIYPDTWFQALIFNAKCDVLLIPDLRFKNEFDFIKKQGGVCVKINRAGQQQFGDPADSDLADETRWDFEIENDGSLGDLNQKAVLFGKDLGIL